MSGKEKGVLIVIGGPTGSGKTGVAINMARQLNTVIISADSRQIYRELKIGTAAPTQNEEKQAKHYLTGNKSIHDYYNASIFEKEALSLLEELFRRHRVVLAAGGSGLYIDALCRGIDEMPDIDPQLRENLIKEYREKGIEHLQNKLKKVDPDHYRKADLNNPKRLLRAIEVSVMTGTPYSQHLTGQCKKRDFKIVKTAITLPREELYSRINQRTDRMIEKGLVDEARKYYRFRHLNALNTVGYKELFSYFDGDIDFQEAVRLIKRNTRRYARRQITWFKKDNDIKWFSADDDGAILSYIESVAKNHNG